MIRICGGVSLVCAAWNLFGDLYYLDFYTAHLSSDAFGMISTTPQSGYMFDFTSNRTAWLVYLAQSGSWMYPFWAFATGYLLHVGLQPREKHHRDPKHSLFVARVAGPCFLMLYGLLIVGGGLHNAFSFLTILPNVYHDSNQDWSGFSSDESFLRFLGTAQSQVILHIGVGTFPGYVACNVAVLWVTWLVQFGDTNLPKKIHFFNPICTLIWVQILGSFLPDPWGFYLVGCLGTWGLMIFNLGMSYLLWNEGNECDSAERPPLLSERSAADGVLNYESVHEGILS
jgi:hypothetical protein